MPFAYSQDYTEFPVGVERTWTLLSGKTITGKLEPGNRHAGAGNPSFSIKGPAGNQAGGVSNALPFSQRAIPFGPRVSDTLHPKDLMWIRSAIEWHKYGDQYQKPLDPTQFANAGKDLDRDKLHWRMVETMPHSGSSIQTALARFALWWDQEGYLPISRKGDLAEKYGDFARNFERHFNTRSESNSRFDEVAKAVEDLVQGEYSEPVILASKEVPDCSPEVLAHYCKGRQATILGLTSFRKTEREYTWRAALLNATPNGQVELELYGNKIIGQVKAVDRSEKMSSLPAVGAWEIEILNREEIDLRAIDEDVRLFIDPTWQNTLWVFKPYLMTSKDLKAMTAPLIASPEVNEKDLDTPANPTEKTAPAFSLRTNATSISYDWATPLKLARGWSRIGGRILKETFQGVKRLDTGQIALINRGAHHQTPASRSRFWRLLYSRSVDQ